MFSPVAQQVLFALERACWGERLGVTQRLFTGDIYGLERVPDAGRTNPHDLGHLALQQVGLLFDELGQLVTVDLVPGFGAGFASLVIGGGCSHMYTMARETAKNLAASTLLAPPAM
jgi:hypothetical protein